MNSGMADEAPRELSVGLYGSKVSVLGVTLDSVFDVYPPDLLRSIKRSILKFLRSGQKTCRKLAWQLTLARDVEMTPGERASYPPVSWEYMSRFKTQQTLLYADLYEADLSVLCYFERLMQRRDKADTWDKRFRDEHSERGTSLMDTDWVCKYLIPKIDKCDPLPPGFAEPELHERTKHKVKEYGQVKYDVGEDGALAMVTKLELRMHDKVKEEIEGSCAMPMAARECIRVYVQRVEIM